VRAPGWFGAAAETPLRRLALLPLSALAQLYGLGARLHRAAYRRGWREARRLPCPVVSVGSLAAGGSGKTPLAAWLAAGLRARGHRVALASRGYGRRGGAAVEVVSDGSAVRCGPERAGDEPLLLAAHAPGVPVLVARDRGAAGLRALADFGSELLVLDDGFQHHRLRRDLDLVVLDGLAGLAGGRVLPRGPLREPLAALSLADAIVVMDGPLAAGDEARVAALAPRAARFAARRVPQRLRRLGGEADEPLASLAGAAVGMLCGIARPASFRRTLEGLGARIVAERVFPDHHAFRAADLAGLAAAAPLWVTTEKDAVKLDPGWASAALLRVLAIEVAGAEGLVELVEARLAQPRPEAR
jgi:tetraacyldisaccharide 4'-kinase